MSRPPLILIVDDEEIIRNILRKLSRNLGYDTLLASSSSEALLLLKAHTPDLVLLDVMMPNSNSMDVVRAIRNKSVAKCTRIIIMPATENQGDITTFIKAGADDVLLKPFNGMLLKIRISNNLEAIQHIHAMKKAEDELANCQFKRVESETVQSERYQRLAHNLNNTLAGIMMSAEFILTKDHPETIDNDINDIIESAEQASVMINDVKSTPLS